jgi:hypothetical protein
MTDKSHFLEKPGLIAIKRERDLLADGLDTKYCPQKKMVLGFAVFH